MDVGREQKSGRYRAQLCYNPENWLDFTAWRFIQMIWENIKGEKQNLSR